MSSRILFDISIFDIRDPETGRRRCRWCGKLVPPGRKIYYCSDDCRDRFYKAMSWDWTRRQIWERDGRRCRICKELVKLHYGNRMRLDGEWIDVSRWKLLETHHIIPVKELRKVAWAAIQEIHNEAKHVKDVIDGVVDREARERRDNIRYKARRAYIKAMMLLYFDWNNLITYCVECHNMVHSAEFRKGRIPQADYTKFSREWRAFLRLNEKTLLMRPLSYFWGSKK